ncbi:MAG: hypothetical protein KGN02_02410 [bacterium]|nr:hypothetical protein [bacterium]
MKLIEEPRVGSAYAFGWSKIAVVLAEYWWLYALAVLLDAAVATWGATDTSFRTGTFEWLIIGFPALASCARLVRPDARMHARDVLTIIGIAAIIVAGIALLAGMVFLITLLSRGFAFVAAIGSFCIVIWLWTKLSFAPIFFLNENPRNFTSAFDSSMDRISSDAWWSALGLGIAVGFTIGVPSGIVLAIVGVHLGTLIALGGRVPLFAIACTVNALSIVSAVWSTAAMTAFASAFGTFGETPEALDAA